MSKENKQFIIIVVSAFFIVPSVYLIYKIFFSSINISFNKKEVSILTDNFLKLRSIEDNTIFIIKCSEKYSIGDTVWIGYDDKISPRSKVSVYGNSNKYVVIK